MIARKGGEIMRQTIALIVGILIASFVGSSANAWKVDWAKAKPIEPHEMIWLLAEHPDGLKAMFAIPESDGALLWMDCAAKGSLSLTSIPSCSRTRHIALT